MEDGCLTHSDVVNAPVVCSTMIKGKSINSPSSKKCDAPVITPSRIDKDTADEVENAEEIAMLQNALSVVSDRYAKAKLELEELRHIQRVEGARSSMGTASRLKSSWASSFINKHIKPKINMRPDELPSPPRTTPLHQTEAVQLEEKLDTTSSSSESSSEDQRDKSASLELSKTDVLLNQQIRECKEELAEAREKLESWNDALEEREESVRELKIENRQIAFEYEKTLQKARTEFEEKVADLNANHASEKAFLEAELLKINEKSIKDIKIETQRKMKQNTEDSDGLIIKAQTRFQEKIKELEQTHKLAINAECESKDLELELLRREISTLTNRFYTVKLETAHNQRDLKEAISTLQKELEIEKDKSRKTARILTTSTEPSLPSIIVKRENPLSHSSQSSSIHPIHPASSGCSTPNRPESLKSLQKQAANIKLRLELEKQALIQALRNVRLTEIGTRDLQEVANSLTQEMLEKDNIIKQLKASISAMGQELLEKKKAVGTRKS